MSATPDGSAIARDWLYTNVLMAVVWSELTDTAAETMDGEVPSGRASENWAAGPTLGEVFAADEHAYEELSNRAWRGILDEQQADAQLEDEYWDRRAWSPE